MGGHLYCLFIHSLQFALGKEDNWKQTSSFIITVTGDSTSGSEDSEDEVATPSPPPPPPPPLFFGKILDDLPPRVIPPLPMDLGLPVSPGFKPQSILVSESGPSTSSAETEGAPPGKSVVTSAVAVAASPPAKSATKDGEGGDSSQEGTVSVEVAAPVKVGNSIKSSSLRLPQRWGGSAPGTVESAGHMEVGASSGKGKESAVKQGVCVCVCVCACVRACVCVQADVQEGNCCVCMTVCGGAIQCKYVCMQCTLRSMHARGWS